MSYPLTPTLSLGGEREKLDEWRMIAEVAGLELVGVFFAVRTRNAGEV